MKIKITLLNILIVCTTFVIAQSEKGLIDISLIPAPNWHYQEEYTLDKPSDPSDWAKVDDGLNAAFGSTNELYLRCEVPELQESPNVWRTSAWRGERKNTQLIVWSTDTLEQVRARISSLVDENGNMISSRNVKFNTVRYVLSDYPYNALPENCSSSSENVWLMPDRFEPHDRFDLPAFTVRPIWLSLEIPEGAIPGVYKGIVEVSSTSESKSLPIEITVQKQILPNPSNWKFRLDLWQNPWVIAWYYNVEPWSSEHMSLLRQHMKTYADAGGTYITTYAVHSPWTDNSYMIEGGMIEWIRTENKSWKFDYTIFDKYVKLCMELGINEAITIYTPVPWGNRFRYLDEVSGNYVYEEWSVESNEFKSNWNIFLNDLKLHLNNNGWFDKTYIGINENPMDVTLAAIKAVKENSKDWKITYAGDWHCELSTLIDDYCSVIPKEPELEDIVKRNEIGFTSTFYVCCTPAKPNNFVFSPPIEGRFMGWYAMSKGYDGFLRWAFDAWPADPLRDARHTLWPAGDCFLVYPGGNSSIRFEKLREGIVDYEKIRIIKELASHNGTEKVRALIKELDLILFSMQNPAYDSLDGYNAIKMVKDIKRGDEIISSLSELLKLY